MKKALILVSVALLCIFAVSASDNTVRVSFVPYGFQISTSSVDGQEPVNSRYGIGLEAVYQRTLYKGLFAQAGLGWNTFLLPDDRPSFTNILAFGGLGYRADLSSKWSCSVNVGAGSDTIIYKKTVSETFTLLAGLDVAYAVNDNTSISVGCNGSFGFANKDSANYMNYRILPNLGVNFGF